jgi:predicted TIM-barrel fold metal-dependent hydrolase
MVSVEVGSELQRGARQLDPPTVTREESQMDFGADRTSEVCPGPDPTPRGPRRFALPAGSVDTHAHVVGTEFVPSRSYTPPPAVASDYIRMLDATGMTYGVLVQISVHGTDNSLMLDTLSERRDRLRGIAVVNSDVTEAELSRLHAAGVVGLRLNTLSGGGIGLDDLGRYNAICAEMGWHLQFLTTTAHLPDAAEKLRALTVHYVIDHMGDFTVDADTGADDWQLMLSLMRDGAWVKLSGAFRMSNDPTYADTIPFARSLVEAAPERCVWGSDWPHVGFWGTMPNVGTLIDLLADWVPDTTLRDNILTTNAHRLYGFG